MPLLQTFSEGLLSFGEDGPIYGGGTAISVWLVGKKWWSSDSRAQNARDCDCESHIKPCYHMFTRGL